MTGKARERNSAFFIAIGTSLASRGAAGAGVGLVGVGIVFVVLGAVRRSAKN